MVILTLIGAAVPLCAQQRNDKLLNRPYSDLRPWHLGFSIGVHTQDLRFTHNGFVTENGETWFTEQPHFHPASVSTDFSTCVLTHISVYASPPACISATAS